MAHPFCFEPDASRPPEAAFVIRIPRGLVTKESLCSELGRAAGFPLYFDCNWDSISDCLRDFSWVEEKLIFIAHEDLPLAGDPVNCSFYLHVLQDALDDWRGDESHSLKITFPSAVQDQLTTAWLVRR